MLRTSAGETDRGNHVRGESSLREVEQDTREEDANTGAEGVGSGQTCHNQVQAKLSPFGVTPGPTTGPSITELGDSKAMDLN